MVGFDDDKPWRVVHVPHGARVSDWLCDRCFRKSPGSWAQRAGHPHVCLWVGKCGHLTISKTAVWGT